jgi:hypothetical protein
MGTQKILSCMVTAVIPSIHLPVVLNFYCRFEIWKLLRSKAYELWLLSGGETWMRFSQQYCWGFSLLVCALCHWLSGFLHHSPKDTASHPWKPEMLLIFLAFIFYPIFFCLLFLCSDTIHCLQRGQKACVLHSRPVYPDNSWKFVVACSKAKAILASFCCPKNKGPFSVGLQENPVTSARNLQRPARHLQNVRSPSL